MDEMTFEHAMGIARESVDQNPGEQKVAIIDSIFSILSSAFGIWESKEKTKYIDKLMSLQKDWNDEKSRADYSRAALDNIRIELRILAAAFSTAAKPKDV